MTHNSHDKPQLDSGTVPRVVQWTCLLCGRNKFSRAGQPHRCAGGYRKRFKAEAKRRGIENAFVVTLNPANHTSPCNDTKSKAKK